MRKLSIFRNGESVGFCMIFHNEITQLGNLLISDDSEMVKTIIDEIMRIPYSGDLGIFIYGDIYSWKFENL